MIHLPERRPPSGGELQVKPPALTVWQWCWMRLYSEAGGRKWELRIIKLCSYECSRYNSIINKNSSLCIWSVPPHHILTGRRGLCVGGDASVSLSSWRGVHGELHLKSGIHKMALCWQRPLNNGRAPVGGPLWGGPCGRAPVEHWTGWRWAQREPKRCWAPFWKVDMLFFPLSIS